MTGKERLLTAFENKQPDMVPIAPDIDLIGMRWWAEKVKKPWWQVYLYNDPPLRDVYIEANKKLGCDIWDYMHGIKSESPVTPKREIIKKTEDKTTVEYITETPYGKLREIIDYPKDNPPWHKERLIKDIQEDWPKLKWLMKQQKWLPQIVPEDSIGNLGLVEVGVDLFPDFWTSIRGSEQMLFDFFDSPKIMDEIFQFYYEYVIELTKVEIRAKPGAIFIQGSSSSMSLISPSIYFKYCLPITKEVTRLCKEAGIISHQHNCGKSRKIVEINYQNTDLNVMEPLEGKSTGDVDLSEIKKKFGDRLCLKGNINTVTLLQGSPRDVENGVRKGIEDAGENGGFVLSTGDSPGRDTPDANIYKMIEAGRKYGKY